MFALKNKDEEVSKEIFKFLVQNHADLHVKTNKGKTLEDYAKKYKKRFVSEYNL